MPWTAKCRLHELPVPVLGSEQMMQLLARPLADLGMRPLRLRSNMQIKPQVIRRGWFPAGLFAFVWGILGVAACAGREEAQRPGQHADTEPFVELTARLELRLGSQDDPEMGLSRIGSTGRLVLRVADVDTEGNLYVFESADLQIRVFDREGKPLRRIGRRGQGPGEFRSVAAIAVIGDTLVALETRSLSLITLFDLFGNVIGTARSEGVATPFREGQALMVTPQFLGMDRYFVS